VSDSDRAREAVEQSDETGMEDAAPAETERESETDVVREPDRKPESERDAITVDEEKDDARKIVTGEARYTADYRD